MELGDYISKYRKEAGLTIDELASLSNVPKGTINKIIAGTTKSPTLETVQSLATALGKSINDFTDSPTKKAPLYSSEAEKLAQDYDALDSYGKRVVRLVLDAEKVRCAEQAQSSKVIKIAARDGHFTEIRLTDDQIKDLQAYIDRLPDPSDDL